VQRLFGQAMLGRVEEHIMPIFTGSGRNGKGTLRDAVMHAFGDYALEIDPKILLEQKNDIHKTYEMELMGRRLVFCSETKKDRKFDAASMKRIVGGDQLQGQRMHKDPVSFDPTHTLVMLTNDLPKIDAEDTAAWARLRVIPFNVVIPKEEQDGTLPHRLKDAAPAVMAWVYEGWLEYGKQGLNEPQAVLVRTDEYHNENDTVGKFLAERTQKNVNSSVKAAEFYEEYAKFCREEGVEIVPQSVFSKSLISAGATKHRRNSGAVYQGFIIMDCGDE
jgi:putative DNA primase/helicase